MDSIFQLIQDGHPHVRTDGYTLNYECAKFALVLVGTRVYQTRSGEIGFLTFMKCSMALFTQSRHVSPVDTFWFIEALVSTMKTTNILTGR